MFALRRFVSVCVTVLCCVPALPAQGKSKHLDFQELLQGLVDLDALWQPVRPGEREWQASSYDRASDKGPGDEKAWFANGDAGHFVRVDAVAGGGKSYVLCDALGPGVIQRIWSANPHGKLSFTFDGEAQPRWTVDFAALLRGEVAPLMPPLCSTLARGGNCFLPIPFGKRVVVSCDEGGFYYQVNVRNPGEGITVDSFRPEWLVSQGDVIAGINRELTIAGAVARGSAGEVASRADDEAVRIVRQTLHGPALITEFAVDFAWPKGGAAPDELGRRALLRIDCDGERTVDVPLGDFFGCGAELRDWHSIALEVAGARCVCRFPIPVRESCTIEVDSGVDGVTPKLSWHSAERPIPADALRFRAGFTMLRDFRTRPFVDHVVLDAKGSGRFAGVTLAVRNPTRAWWGEGDEKAWVDGESFPSTFGTGTEDYFGYAWCCPELFSHPYHAQPRADGPANFGFVSNVRLQITDAIPFHDHMKFALEIWHWKDVHIDYATCAYWYGSAGSTSGLPTLPALEARLPTPLQTPPMFVADHALEGEDMKIVERTGGSTSVQDLSGFAEMRWSKDAQLWWVDGKPGDRLVLGLPVQTSARYRIEAVLTTARDYGKVQLELDGEKLGGEIDLYTPNVEATAVLDLGTADLSEGDHRLGFVITGHNDKAIPSHMVGIDWVRLVPVK